MLNIPTSHKSINQRFIDHFAGKVFHFLPNNIEESKEYLHFRISCRDLFLIINVVDISYLFLYLLLLPRKFRYLSFKN